MNEEEATYKAQRDEMWAEVRDLLNFRRPLKGPLAEMLQNALDEAREHFGDMDEIDYEIAADAMRAELIALRCAFIARTCAHTAWYGMPPSLVLGSWAGQSMECEHRENLMRALFDRFFQE